MRKLGFIFLSASICAAVMAHYCSVASVAAPSAQSGLMAKAHIAKSSDDDLAIGGDLEGLPPRGPRYLSREDLLTLPQVTYTVTDDANFARPTEITGVSLEDLIRSAAHDPDADLVIAICSDGYHAHYMHSYLSRHHPLLVLKINGQPPERWPTDAEGHGQSMGPYLISHRKFAPGFKILAHQEEAQIPWGVMALEFRNEKKFLAAIAPAREASDPPVEAGYRIAQQNCVRCHNLGDVGGQKARHPWLVLSAWAKASPERFAAYVRNPQAENPQAEMPANPNYDAATLRALVAYFQTFQSSH